MNSANFVIPSLDKPALYHCFLWLCYAYFLLLFAASYVSRIQGKSRQISSAIKTRMRSSFYFSVRHFFAEHYIAEFATSAHPCDASSLNTFPDVRLRLAVSRARAVVLQTPFHTDDPVLRPGCK